jgi:hypothetical protein
MDTSLMTGLALLGGGAALLLHGRSEDDEDQDDSDGVYRFIGGGAVSLIALAVSSGLGYQRANRCEERLPPALDPTHAVSPNIPEPPSENEKAAP